MKDIPRLLQCASVLRSVQEYIILLRVAWYCRELEYSVLREVHKNILSCIRILVMLKIEIASLEVYYIIFTSMSVCHAILLTQITTRLLPCECIAAKDQILKLEDMRHASEL